MLLTDLRRDQLSDGRFELSTQVQLADGTSSRLWIRVADTFGGPEPDDASPFIPGLLPLCMRLGENLEIQARISARLHKSLDRLQEVLWSFWPGVMRQVSVVAPQREIPPGPRATVSSFTRGVDSWYTVLTADDDADQNGRPPLSHLIFVPSADIWDAERAERDRQRCAEAADLAGLPLLAPETNLRELSEPILGWEEYYGGFLAACGLALGPSHVLIPSGGGGGELAPNGAHPMLDPLWSTERTTIVHHGDVTRFSKTQIVAKSPAALATLRTCWLVEGNCGRCQKCLHTMAALELAGALRDCPTFPDSVDPRVVVSAEAAAGARLRWQLVASRCPDDADGRAKRLAAELVVLRQRLNELASNCEALEPRLDDREAVQRAVPGLDAELRATFAQSRDLAARLKEVLRSDAAG